MTITGDETLDEPPFYKEDEGILEAPLHGGLCRLRVKTGWSTGPVGSDSHPGVHVDLMWGQPHTLRRQDEHGRYTWGGILGRSAATLLRDALDKFLRDNGN